MFDRFENCAAIYYNNLLIILTPRRAKPRRLRELVVDKTRKTRPCSLFQVTRIGDLNPIRGFSSFKFLPGSQDSIIVALKTEEYQGRTATYIMAFTLEGLILMPESKVMDKKFEGLEFI